ncbi:MAG: TetR/AcrR family transcriptional regulator [Tepidiformaceae bacterium]
MRTKGSPGGQETPSFIEAARRAQIIEAAIDTLAEVGYSRASLAEIARRAAISKSAISYYFTSKEDLLRQVVIGLFEEGAAFMVPRIMAETSAALALQAYIATNVQFIAEHARHLKAVGEVLVNLHGKDGNPPWDDSSKDWMFEGLEQLFIWGHETGEFRPFSPRVMAISLRAAIDALSTQLLIRPDLDVPEYAAELTTLFDLATRNPDRVQPPVSRLNLATQTKKEQTL